MPANTSDAVTIAMTLIHIFGWIVFWFLGETALVFFMERRHVRVGGRWGWAIGLTVVLPGALFFFGLFDTAFHFRESMRRSEELTRQALEQAKARAAAAHQAQQQAHHEAEPGPENNEDNTEEPRVPSPYSDMGPQDDAKETEEKNEKGDE